MICPVCCRWLRGRYCNQGHPMRRGRLPTAEEAGALADEIDRAYRRKIGQDKRDEARAALAMALALAGGGR